MSRLAWPLHRAGIREDAVRADSVLIVPGDTERFELWVDGEQPRSFINVIYVNDCENSNSWTEKKEIYCRLSDLPEELRSEVHDALSKKLIPEFDAKQKTKYSI